MASKFICIHIGARAHYLIPKALFTSGRLSLLVTDTWIANPIVRTILKRIPVRIIQSFANRYADVLKNISVASATIYFFIIELKLRKKYKHGWQLICARNEAFQTWAKKNIAHTSEEHNLFAISYTALEIFKAPYSRVRKKVLFQIDPGLEEEIIVAQLIDQHAATFPTTWEKAPKEYWTNWLEECKLSDSILVNSEWSKEGLLRQGILKEKIHVLPLPFEIEKKHINFKRSYPAKFTAERPMVCLFLGTLTLRKGIHLVLEAAHQLRSKPVQFILVGNNELNTDFTVLPNVSYKGVCSRDETQMWYKNADVFLFPTLSDGFGLTQLEAMAWSVPVVASTFCGNVVEDNVNGTILKDCTTNALVERINEYLLHPQKLQLHSDRCIETVEKYSVERFSTGLEKLL